MHCKLVFYGFNMFPDYTIYRNFMGRNMFCLKNQYYFNKAIS